MQSEVSSSSVADPGWRWCFSYQDLPGVLYARVLPTPVSFARCLVVNTSLAFEMGLDPEVLTTPGLARSLGGCEIPTGSRPIAQAYAGHQFGHFTRLGDGRALLLGEHRCPDGRLVDIQLKGAGPTPYSRRGDGRAAVGPMLREFLVSEAMHALGIPTSRSLAVVSTGDPVFRETPLPGAVLTRVAASHVRVGTFQWASLQEDPSLVRVLADYTLRRHVPVLAESSQPHLDFLGWVVERQADLVARWLWVGFIHGVMNTDNMALSGETLDYGPCAFMDTYHPGTVFSSIDQQGRYAYGRQPAMAQWNLARLAETLLPLLDPDPGRAVEKAEEALRRFAPRFEAVWLAGMTGRLGLFEVRDGDAALVESLLAWMQGRRLDYTLTFRRLHPGGMPDEDPWNDPAFREWETRWSSRWQEQGRTQEEVIQRMKAHNPMVIPRNHRVEQALRAAEEGGDMGPFHRLWESVRRPWEDRAWDDEDVRPPREDERVRQTFCGT